MTEPTPEQRALAVVARTYGATSRQALGEAIAAAIRAAVNAERERAAVVADSFAATRPSEDHAAVRLAAEIAAAIRAG